LAPTDAASLASLAVKRVNKYRGWVSLANKQDGGEQIKIREGGQIKPSMEESK
jgi:hypothetical protein